MTVSTIASQSIVFGNGANTSFSFGFIADSAANIQVTYTNLNGQANILSPATYTLTINPATTNQIWGIGGTVVYPLTGSPIASGTSLTIARIVPLTQNTSISDQGDFYPQTVEEAMDILCFEIQQIAARGGAIRGIWATGITYNFGDIVQDGSNGNNTNNLYTCAVANTSGTWTTDLAAGDWALALNVQALSGFLPLTGGTISGNLGVIGTTTGTGGFIGNLTGNVSGSSGSTTGNAATTTKLATARTIAVTGDLAYTSPAFDGSGNVTAAGTLATVNSNVGSFTNTSVTVNAKGLVTAASSGVISFPSQAWVNFVGSTGVVTDSGGNGPLVGSVTRNSTGDYTINFSNLRSNATYGIWGMATNTSTAGTIVGQKTGTTNTTNGAEILCTTGGTPVDPAHVYVFIWGN